MPELLHVSVVRATPSRQVVRELALPRGATVADAIRAGGFQETAGQAGVAVGVFGRVVDAATPLRDGDRVEIYRALKIDPKEARRRRAAAKPARQDHR